jgi:hypothetical protein
LPKFCAGDKIDPGMASSELRVSRRRVLQLGAGLTTALVLPGCESTPEEETCSLVPQIPRLPAPGPDWLRDARVAGFEAYGQQPVCELKQILDGMADQHVSVVEIDSELSSYLTEDQFREQATLFDAIARGCHARGMRAVAYYPTFEVLTADAAKTPHTMAKDHPEWLQVSITGRPNVFIGGGGRVFWVEPGQESAWTCPTSGYLDYFNARVAILARTALDGLWGDVPLFSDIVGQWPCVNDTCKSKFFTDTGFHAPTMVDWEDPVFRRWVRWRHRVIWEFEQSVVKAAKQARGDFEVIIETVTMDYTAGTVQGLDGANADDGQIYRVWEVDAVSDATAMRDADADDWISMAVMMKHGRGASRPHPSWIFAYGLKDEDAEHVIALAVATGNNPYESKIPVMNTSVGAAYRGRLFAWLERNTEIYRSESANPIAVLFSSESRDFLDRDAGVGLYTSQNPADSLWWSENPPDSAKELDYLGDYRGMLKCLIHAHLPCEVVTAPHATAATLERYRMLVAPSPIAASDALITTLCDWVKGGRTLVLSGPDAGLLSEEGAKRGAPELLSRLGLDPKVGGWTERPVGAGRVVFSPERVGRAYFRTGDAALRATLQASADAASARRALTSGAPLALVLDLRRTTAGHLQLLVANLDGLGEKGVGSFAPRSASFKVELEAGGKQAKKVTLSRPDGGLADVELPFTTAGGRVAFSIQVSALALASVELA